MTKRQLVESVTSQVVQQLERKPLREDAYSDKIARGFGVPGVNVKLNIQSRTATATYSGEYLAAILSCSWDEDFNIDPNQTGLRISPVSSNGKVVFVNGKPAKLLNTTLQISKELAAILKMVDRSDKFAYDTRMVIAQLATKAASMR